MPHIETKPHFARNYVSSARLGLNLPNRRDQIGGSVGLAFDDRNPFGGSGERVVPKIHRSSAGVIGLAREANLQPALAYDCFDDRERKIETFENRTLLDVEFQIAS